VELHHRNVPLRNVFQDYVVSLLAVLRFSLPSSLH